MTDILKAILEIRLTKIFLPPQCDFIFWQGCVFIIKLNPVPQMVELQGQCRANTAVVDDLESWVSLFRNALRIDIVS